MKFLYVFAIGFLISILVTSCATYNSVQFQRDLGVKLVDSLATQETVTLFHNLKKSSRKQIIFGHQNSTEYGVYWHNDTLRSDVHDVTGSFPGLYGWDFESIPRSDSDVIRHRVPKLVRQAYDRGGINTFSWHMRNPVTDNYYSDTTIAVKHILPGGKFHQKFLTMIDSVVDYTKQLVDKNGRSIPIIFRPYHEFDGSWFWWGKRFCTKDEFIELWRMTVDYLRNQKQIKYFLYVYSPDRHFINEKEYLERYPGDEYVDIFGLDDYYDFVYGGDTILLVQQKLKVISSLAEKKNKIAAFTETGSERIPDSTWWTTKLYRVLDNDSVKIAYVMLWRNAHIRHFYVPYSGHPSEENFKEFKKKPRIWFEENLPDMYHTILLPELLSKLQSQEKIIPGQ